MEKILIVGFGSPYGNDQCGWLVIDELENLFPHSEFIALYKSKGNGVDWLSELSGSVNVIIVDAVKSNKPIGSLHDFLLEENAEASTSLFTSSHSISILESVALGKELGMLKGEVRFMGVNFDIDQEELVEGVNHLETSVCLLVTKLNLVIQKSAEHQS